MTDRYWNGVLIVVRCCPSCAVQLKHMEVQIQCFASMVVIGFQNKLVFANMRFRCCSEKKNWEVGFDWVAHFSWQTAPYICLYFLYWRLFHESWALEIFVRLHFLAVHMILLKFLPQHVSLCSTALQNMSEIFAGLLSSSHVWSSVSVCCSCCFEKVAHAMDSIVKVIQSNVFRMREDIFSGRI